MVASLAKEPGPQKPTGFVAAVHVEKGRRLLAIIATVGKTKEVTARIRDAKSSQEVAVGGPHVFLPTDEGILQTSIPIGEGTGDIEVILEWEGGTGMKMQASRKVPH
jgi:hypothetical protein